MGIHRSIIMRFGITRWLRKRLVTEIARSLCKQRCAERLILGRIGVRTRTRPLEGIATVDDLTFDVAGLARRTAEIFKTIVVRLKVVIGDTPILDRHILRNESSAV